MNFCPRCKNMYSITNNIENIIGKTQQNQQKGGTTHNFEKLIEQILAKQQIKIPDNFPLNSLTESSEYRKLNTKQKEYVYNKITDGISIKEKSKHPTAKQNFKPMYFVCLTCAYHEPIESTKLIYNNVGSNISQNYIPPSLDHMALSNIIPRTRRYFCPNDECLSHTNPDKKEAVFFRLNNSHQIKYICQICKTIF